MKLRKTPGRITVLEMRNITGSVSCGPVAGG